MKIGYVLRRYPKLSETFVLNEMLELERQGDEISIFSLGSPLDSRFHPGVGRLRATVHYVHYSKSSDLVSKLSVQQELAGRIAPAVGAAFLELIAQEEPEAFRILQWALQISVLALENGVEQLHAHFANQAAVAASIASRMTGIPYSVTCHAKDIYHSSVSKLAFRTMAGRAKHLVTVCNANADYITTQLTAGLSTPVHRVYNGIDRNLFPFCPRGVRPDVPLVLGVGRLVEKKGFEILVEAASLIERSGRKVDFLIAGEGRERAHLEALAEERSVRCLTMPGAVSQDQVGELMDRATLLAMPCIIGEDGNRDALPTVILEAMASGVPVISTAVTGIAEMLEEGQAGILVPQSDPPALAKAIIDLLDQPHVAQRLVLRARTRVDELFDLGTNVALLRGLWHSPSGNEAVA